MSDSPASGIRPSAPLPLLLLVLAVTVYFGGPMLRGPTQPWNGHFPHLAEAFLHGRLDLQPEADKPIRLDELIQAEGGSRLYCPYPPLPAILLMPVMLVFGPLLTVETATRAVSVVNLLLFDACLLKLPSVLGFPRLRWSGRVMLDLLFGLGTAALHNAWMGGDWHLAHAVTLCAMLFGLLEFSRGKRPLLLGICIGAVILTRPTAAPASLLLVLPFFRSRQIGNLVQLAVPLVFAITLLAGYNLARFGDPLDFGYDRMFLSGPGKLRMDTYGQFHPHFIMGNLFWFFLAPPWPLAAGEFPWLGFDPRGLSLFLSCPAMIYVFAGIKRRWQLAAVRDATLAAMLAIVPLLLYFNTGYWQFGHRFSLDYLVPLLVLVLAGVGPRPGIRAFTATAAAIIIQFWGVVISPVTRLPIG